MAVVGGALMLGLVFYSYWMQFVPTLDRYPQLASDAEKNILESLKRLLSETAVSIPNPDGVPIYVEPTVENEKTARRPSREQVREAQSILKKLGLNPGPIDGLLGPQTKAALLQFQASRGLPTSGLLDAATNKALIQARHNT
jgi:hypothetical protein